MEKINEECNETVFSFIQIEFVKGQDINYNALLKGNLKSNGVKKSYNFLFDKDGELIKD